MNIEFILNPFSLTFFLSGIIGIIAAFIQQKNPPRKINGLYGYRTSTSLKNQKTWDFAQEKSSEIMLKGSVYMLLTGFLGYFLPLSMTWLMILGVSILLIWVFILIYKTERAIKNHFPELFN